MRPPAFGREARLGGFDVTRHTQPVRRCLFGARDDKREWRENERCSFVIRHWSFVLSHGASIRLAVS